MFSDYRVRKAENRPVSRMGNILATDECVLRHRDKCFEIYRRNDNGHYQLTRDGQIYHQNWQYRSLSLYREPYKLPEDIFTI